jgi:hypothetical protein
MSVLKIFDGTSWNIVGLQGIQGETGNIGITGLQGATGLEGSTGLQGNRGYTGAQIILDQMVVEKTCGITGISETGFNGLSYNPITGLYTTISIPREGRLLSLLSLKYRNITPGSQTISFLLQSNGETGPFISEYVSDAREQSEVLYQVTAPLPVGTHNIQAYWKSDTLGKQTRLMNGCLSTILLEGAVGIQGNTGSIGLPGPTGPYGGPIGYTGSQGITGYQGYTGLEGIRGETGLGLSSFDKFVKILPMESWKLTDIEYDVFGTIPVLKFQSTGYEKIENVISVPYEWGGTDDILLKAGVILNTPLSSGAQLILRLSYKGFNKGDNVSSLAPLHTNIVPKTFSSPSQYDFFEYEFTIDKDFISSYDYIYLRIDKISGSPNIPIMGICSSYIEHGVVVGMGPTGRMGIPGPTGAYGGPPGVTGLQGAVGYTGNKGETGISILGHTGLVGPTGYQGITGNKGETGISIPGYTGLVGPTGYQGITGNKGETGIPFPGVTGAIGITGLQGAIGETGIEGAKGETGVASLIPEQVIFNSVSRYEVVSSTGEEVWLVSSSTAFLNCNWTRSGTNLTIYNNSHGHTPGNRIIIRNTNLDYQSVVITGAYTNYFIVTTIDTGDTSGSNAAYSLGFTFAHSGSPKSGGVLSAPTGAHADCQLISMRIRTGSRLGTTYSLTVPTSAVNGAGADTSLGNSYIPDFNIRYDADTLSAVPATMIVNSGSAGYNIFTFGGLGSLSRIICLHF